MNKFPFRYSYLIIVLLSAVSVIFGASAALNVVNAVNHEIDGLLPIFFYVFLAALSLVMFVFSTAALLFGKYTVKNGFLYCRFGLLYSKTPIKDIFQLTEFKANKKLVAYLVSEEFTVIVVKEKYYAPLYEELKKVNPRIVYTIAESFSDKGNDGEIQ